MTAGILRNQYIKRLGNAKYPFEYFAILNEFMMYEFKVMRYNSEIPNFFSKR